MTERSDYRKLVKAATKTGARIVESNGHGHRKLLWPDGSHIVIPGTPGSGKALVSFRQRLRSKGVPV